jgi:hypothetical protein
MCAVLKTFFASIFSELPSKKRDREEDIDLPSTPPPSKRSKMFLTPDSSKFASVCFSSDLKQIDAFENSTFMSYFPNWVDIDNIALQLRDKGCWYSFYCTSSEGESLFKFGFTENLPQRINSLCLKYNLSDIVFDKLYSISKQSYERKMHAMIQTEKKCSGYVNDIPATEIYPSTPTKTVPKLSIKYMNVLINIGKAKLVFSNEP